MPGRPLYRPHQGRAIAGVCIALAQANGWDVAVVRILTILGFFFSGGGGNEGDSYMPWWGWAIIGLLVFVALFWWLLSWLVTSHQRYATSVRHQVEKTSNTGQLPNCVTFFCKVVLTRKER